MLVEVGRLLEEPFSTALAYPRPSSDILEKRIAELRSLGITHVEFCGRKALGKVRVLGKGHVGVVLAGRTASGEKVALKVRRVDADRATLAHEAEMLKLANSVGVGPRLIAHTDDVLVMEFIEGPTLREWLSSTPGAGEASRILLRLLEKCWRLDSIGLDHGELSRAHSHVLIQGWREPRIVDFESASDRRRPSNLTSICQYLFISGVSGLLEAILGPRDRDAIIRALRAYKRDMAEEAFRSVLEACGLARHI